MRCAPNACCPNFAATCNGGAVHFDRADILYQSDREYNSAALPPKIAPVPPKAAPEKQILLLPARFVPKRVEIRLVANAVSYYQYYCLKHFERFW